MWGALQNGKTYKQVNKSWTEWISWRDSISSPEGLWCLLKTDRINIFPDVALKKLEVSSKREIISCSSYSTDYFGCLVLLLLFLILNVIF